MSLVFLGNLLSFSTEIILAIVSLIAFINFKDTKKRIFSVIILVIVCVSICLNYYLLPTNDSTISTLHLTIYRPLVVNTHGTYCDSFIENADYRVLSSESYPVDTRFQVTITNQKTFKSEQYILSDVYNGIYIGNMVAGRYKVDVYHDSILYYSGVIQLSSSNLNNEYEWDCSLYVFDDFYSKAIQRIVSLGEQSYKAVEIKAFTIYSDDTYMFPIFETDFINNIGTFEGEFYFLPGTYYLNDAVSPSSMDEIVIEIG